MKLLIRFTFILFSFITFFAIKDLTVAITNDSYSKYFSNNYEFTEKYYLKLNSESFDESLDIVLKLAEENNTNIKIQISENNGDVTKTIVYYYGDISVSKLHPTLNLNLDIDYKSLDRNSYITTDISDTDTDLYMKSMTDKIITEIRPINQLEVEDLSMLSDTLFFSKNKVNLDSLVSEIETLSFIGKSENKELHLPNNNFKKISIDYFAPIFLMVGAIVLLNILSFLIYRRREVSIRHLNGFSYLEIFKDLFLRELGLNFLIYLLICSLLYLASPIDNFYSELFITNLIRVTFVVFTFFILISAISVLYISKVNLLNLSVFSRFVKFTNKSLLLMLIVFSIVFINKYFLKITTSLYLTQDYFYMINQINRNDEIVIPNGMTFKETEENGEPIIYLDKQLKELFEFYNQIGAEYIDFGNHAMDLRFKYNGFETSTSYHQVNVNENYFINRMNIELDSSLIMDDSLDYMIVPKTFYDENRAGELNCYEAVQCKIIDVDTTGSIYNYNSHIGYPVSRKLTDPVIKIVNNFGTTSFDITKYLIHSSIDELTELEKSSGIQASVSYQRFSDFKQEEFKNVKRYFIENISDSYIYIVLVVLIISQYILLYTISNQKEISVKILNGYSLVESLDEVTKNIILSIIPISIYMIVKGYNLFHTMIFILILFIVAYISITLVASRMLGNMKNIIAWGKKL